MKTMPLLAVVACLAIWPPICSPAATVRRTENFDAGWLFLKADATNAEQNQFGDSGWRKLDLPHDWSIEGPFSKTNQTGGAGGFLPAGVGWYRKHFNVPETGSNQCITIEFDGVMANSDVWINGFHLSHRPYGYVSFSDDLTGHLNFGGDNVIAVRCDNSAQPASRWYSGAGIYRHVRLVETDPVHLAEDGVFVSTPNIESNQARIHIELKVVNDSKSSRHLAVLNYILAPGESYSDIDLSSKPRRSWLGTMRAPENRLPFRRAALEPVPYAKVEPGASTHLSDDLLVTKPQLWSLDRPNMYRLVTRVIASTGTFTNGTERGKIVDEVVTSFGIRDAHFEADTGFWLNGQNFKVKGVCLHADGGAFGAAVPLSIWEARLKTLKSLGVNAIRTAHNPPAPEFLDLCDRMGFLVMDEMFDCWTVGKNPYDYHLYFNEWSKTDERDTILRDRNHPSIILYSLGNEIHDTPQAAKAKKILAGLVAVAHATDPTRPVTQALFRPNASHDYDDGLADLLDVIGQNYRENEILAAHAQKPSRKIIGTENTHDRRQWIAVRDHPPYAGQFIWTGVDYLGESRRWPLVGHGSGLLDRTGAPRPVAFERQSWWSDAPMVFMARRLAPTEAMPVDPGYAADERYSQVLFADWSPKNQLPHDENVEVYSNCKEVELLLNDQSLGVKAIHTDASPRNWSVPFAPGILRAVARGQNGKVAATCELHTARQPAKIILATEIKKLAPGFDHVAIVRAKVVDADGVEIPRADELISFSISGPGVIAAVDNGDNASHESFQAAQCRAFHGECAAFVRATASHGRLVLTATAPGLTAGSISIKTVP